MAWTDSPEFLRFEAWLRANPSLSPYRSEWSVYDDEVQVAGQVDSLWFDMDKGGAVVMADWKRSRHLLSNDLQLQLAQAYGKTGRRDCPFAPEHLGPCRDLFDCAYNHYLAQQHLYADILLRNYDVVVTRMLLVQCHPNIGATVNEFHEVDLPRDLAFAPALLSAFAAGWCQFLNTFAAEKKGVHTKQLLVLSERCDRPRAASLAS